MSELERTLVELARFLDRRDIPYMVIGGFANLRWGRSRLTRDLDVTIHVSEDALPGLLEALAAEWRLLAPDPVAFALERRVIPLEASDGTPIDMILAGLEYERQAIRRAVAVEIAGAPVRLCSAEDLILHKLVSERPRDREDVEGVIMRQARRLDRGYLDPLVRQLAEGLERPAIESFYQECLTRALDSRA